MYKLTPPYLIFLLFAVGVNPHPTVMFSPFFVGWWLAATEIKILNKLSIFLFKNSLSFYKSLTKQNGIEYNTIEVD